MKRTIWVVVFLLVGVVLATAVLADTIVLKKGEKITGRIIGSSPKNTVIKLDSGEMKSYRAEEIEKVVKGDAMLDEPITITRQAGPGSTRPGVTRSSGKARVLALAIGRHIPQDERMQLNLGSPEGTSLTLQVTQLDKCIIALDDDASKLISFTDDKNTDLQKAPEGMWMMGDDWLDSFVNISKDGHHCICTLTAPAIPVAEARELRLKANLALVCGANEKTVEQKGFSLQPGSKLTVGPVPMKVEKPEGFGGGFGGGFGMGQDNVKTKVQLSSEVAPDAIKSLAFIGANGMEIKHDVIMTGSGGFGPNPKYFKIYGLHQKVDQVTVRVTYYASTERVTVPLGMSVGVGLE